MNMLICGGGALGSHTLLVGRDLPAGFAVVDDDRVETKNLAAQWFVKPMVGKNKATALKLQALNFYGLKVRDYAVRLGPENVDTILGDVDLLVDCFDNAASRRLIQDHARARNMPCVHAGLAADGAYGVVRWDSVFTIDEEDQPGQATCEGAGHLPLITRVAAALVRSIQTYLEDTREVNWNLSPDGSESFG